MAAPRPIFAAAGEIIGIDFEPMFVEGIFDWQAAERLGLALLQYLGFDDARMTSAGIDGGIDVVARDACCQVKHWSAAVGRQDLQRLAGAATGRASIFLARTYSAHAITWADAGNVSLFTYDEWAYVEPANPKATVLATTPQYEPMDDRQTAASKRLDRAMVWLVIIGQHAAQLEAGQHRMSNREVRTMKRVANDTIEKTKRAFVAMESRSGVEQAERSLAEIEYELRRLAATLRVHLPE